MSILSEKARAFSVDELLGKKEKQKTSKLADVNKKCSDGSEICPFIGDEPNCRHENVADILDKQGNSVKVELCQSDLWQAFHTLGTEMIITKTGRRMFPAVRVRVTGLKKSSKYRMSMDFIPVDKNKYRYVYHSSRWMVSGVGDSLKADQTYEHPESPMTGEYLTTQVISFEKIKLTNHENPGNGQMSLLSMQKFQPRISIQEKGSSCSSDCSISVTFPQTSFIAVTAYQNQEITRLKIARNPFAKGFREAGKCRSSLEAMMASFGVVLDPSPSQYSPVGKRQFGESNKPDPDELSPPKQPFWNPPLFIDQRFSNHMAMYPPLLLNQQPHITAVSKDSHTLRESETSHADNGEDITLKHSPNSRHKKTTSPFTVSSYSPTSSVSSSALAQLSSRPAYCPTTDIHPAFPYINGVPTSSVDTQALAAYYRGFVQNSSYPNIMFVPSAMFPLQAGSRDFYDSPKNVNKTEENSINEEIQAS